MVTLTEIEDDPPPAPENVPDKPKSESQVKTTGEGVKVFRRPFAFHLFNTKADQFCSECLKEPSVKGKLFTCGACSFAKYCSKECQKMAWKLHKAECARLQKSFPNLPMSEVMFLSKVLDRREDLEKNGDRFGYELVRPFTSLIGHEDDIRKDGERMERVHRLLEKLKTFRGEDVDGARFFETYCKTTINCITVQSPTGEDIALTLDLDASRYDHSCRPNCNMFFDGYYIFLRPLTGDVNTEDVTKATISYTDVGRSRYQRRKDLKTKMYFDCNCDRCKDPADDILTALRCKNVLCDAPILISEDMDPKPVECTKCKTVADVEYVIRGQQTMLELPNTYSRDEKLEKLKGYLELARPILHEKNVYLNRLEAAIVHISGKLGDNIASLYSKVQQTFSNIFPATEVDKPLQLIKKCAELIEKGRRKDAIPLAFDAMCILEATHGLAHPNYLRVLALWTFLDKHPEKSDQELLELTKLDQAADAKQVDITALLSGMDITNQ